MPGLSAIRRTKNENGPASQPDPPDRLQTMDVQRKIRGVHSCHLFAERRVAYPGPMSLDEYSRKPAEQYVDPQRWMAAVTELHLTKARLLDACDQADYTARQAGTPIRTQDVRIKIEELVTEIRLLESKIQMAASGENDTPNAAKERLRKTMYPSFPGLLDRTKTQLRRSGAASGFGHTDLRDPMTKAVGRRDDGRTGFQTSTWAFPNLALRSLNSGNSALSKTLSTPTNKRPLSSSPSRTGKTLRSPDTSAGALNAKEQQIQNALQGDASKIGEATAKRLTELLESFKGSTSTAEFRQLLDLLTSAADGVHPEGLENFSIEFFRSMNPKVLTKLVGELVDESGDFRYPSEKRSAAKQLLAKLNHLFRAALHGETSIAQTPDWANYVKSLSPNCLDGLLQGKHEGAAQISSANIAFLADLALPNPHAMYGFAPVRFDGQPTRSLRLTVLDLLSSDQDSGGSALALYLTPKDRSEPSMKVASEKLLALLNPDRLHDGPFQPRSNLQEDEVAAKLMKKFFVHAFDGGSAAEAQHAGEALELAIANTAQLKTTPTVMIRALATGFAGAMINPVVGSDLLSAAANGSNDERGRADLLHVPTAGFDPNDLDLGDFIARLCSDRRATGQIVAALGPMIASQGKHWNHLPDTSNLMGGTGFILGSILKKFDKDAEYRRTIYDAVGVGLTLTFAAVGGAVSGPVGGVATGALGSGILQNIASMVETRPKPSVAIPTEQRSISYYLKALYISATFRWLEPTVRAHILQRVAISNEEGLGPKAQVTLMDATGELIIANIADLTEDRIRRLTKAMVKGANESAGPKDTPGQQAIRQFAKDASDESDSVR
jgi:hypothetical protein